MKKRLFRSAKVGPDREIPTSSNKKGGKGPGHINNDSMGFAKDMPGGGNRISQGSGMKNTSKDTTSGYGA